MEIEFYKTDFDKEQFQGYWDADRVVSAFVELEAHDALSGINNDPEIELKRIRFYSAYCAFTGTEWNGGIDYCHMGLLSLGYGNWNVKYTESDIQQLRELFVKNGGPQYAKRMDAEEQTKRMAGWAFTALLRKRAYVERALRCYKGFLTAPGPFCIFARFAENIYDSSLIEQNKQVDNILKLLLGSQFKQPISELELIEKYHYPTVTDKEVHDAAMRNL